MCTANTDYNIIQMRLEKMVIKNEFSNLLNPRKDTHTIFYKNFDPLPLSIYGFCKLQTLVHFLQYRTLIQKMKNRASRKNVTINYD